MSVWRPWKRRSAPIKTYDEDDWSYMNDAQPYFTDKQMFDSPWLAEFDLSSPKQLEKAKLIQSLENEAGEAFLVKRQSPLALNGSSAGGSHMILKLDHVPNLSELDQLLFGQFGGGVYNVYAQSRPKLLLISYTLPGEPKYPGRIMRMEDEQQRSGRISGLR